MLSIRKDDLSGEQSQALIRLHLAEMHRFSPPGSVHALDHSALLIPSVTVWTAWSDDRIAGIAALRRLDARGGEIKSMRTHPDMLRRGVAAALLEHIVMTARAEGLRRLSLETGSGDAFAPALSLYRRRGFREGPAFGGYPATEFNRFLHLDLT